MKSSSSLPTWLTGARRFEPGTVTISNAAQEMLRAAHVKVETLLERHCAGDFGDLSDTDRNANEMHLLIGGYVTSVYPLSRLPLGLGRGQVYVYSLLREKWTYICVESEVGNAI